MNEQLKVIISAEVSKFQKGVESANKTIQDLQKKAGLSSKDIDNNFKKMGDGIKSAMATAAKGTAALITALAATSVATEEYRTNQAKLTTAFETAGASANVAKGVYNDLYRVLGDDGQTTEAAAHLAQLTTNEQELSQWTTICEGVYATFGDSLPIEGLTEAANETAKTGQVTGVLADALNWAGISEDDFNAKLAACNSESEREQLIRETLNGTYSTAAAQYEKNAEGILAQNEAQAQLNENLAVIGELMTPFLTVLTSVGAELLGTLAPTLTNIAESVLPPLTEALQVAVGLLSDSLNWLTQHPALLMAIATALGVITGAILLKNTVDAIQAGLQAAKIALNLSETASMGALISALWASAAAHMAALAPYLLIVAAIGAVIAIIVVCIQHWDEIKAKVTEVWNNIKEKTQEAVENVKQKFEDMKQAIHDKVEAIKEKVHEKFEAIKQAISDKVQAAKDAVHEKFEAIKSAISEKVQAAKDTVSNKFSEMKQNMVDKVQGAKDAVINKFQEIKDKIKEKINGAKDAVKTAIDKMKDLFHFSWSLPHLKVPEVVTSGKFSLKPLQVPHFHLQWHAEGGVFDSPTIFGFNGGLHGLGENGAEAIVPLEKNTEWLDKIAERLNRNSDTPIVLQVDGKVFAETSIKSINDLTKQTGKLGLNIY